MTAIHSVSFGGAGSAIAALGQAKRSWVQVPLPQQLKHQVRDLIRIAGQVPDLFPGASGE